MCGERVEVLEWGLLQGRCGGWEVDGRGEDDICGRRGVLRLVVG
jgi:hypothetical protein